ncbi:MLX-interacting protein isoform X2 [Coccinella septempunctata]|uniref:MLX-interacting protein isoform X2 n=1 Tax=Coccinella septempunctata TaxID=41139 RepID=UPI001D0890ED|nr:MLX-interacting protein isoform X2 [Coccinella septempunctata]
MFATNIRALKVEKPERETIHSGHFMVSHFEAEEQDDEDEVAVPVPEENTNTTTIVPVKQFSTGVKDVSMNTTQQHLEIDTSLSKLFQCMTLAYRQKLTSPKWNRFRGIRLRWKEKIRLNNVIWRCWHLQFIKKVPTLICQFASPLDVDTHNKPEAVVLEGKYWKRKLHAVTAEYKKWRMFHRHHSLLQQISRDTQDTIMNEVGLWDSQSNESVHMLVDEDYMDLMSDTLFSTIANQPFHFPDSREIAKAGLADFIQPSLGPLQPNLDDYMDTFEQELMLAKLPTVPEEQQESIYKSTVNWPYSELDLITSTSTIPGTTTSPNPYTQPMQTISSEKAQIIPPHTMQSSNFNEIILPIESSYSQRQPPAAPPPTYQINVISRRKPVTRLSENQIAQNNAMYRSFPETPQNIQMGICEDVSAKKSPRQSPLLVQPSQSTISETPPFKLPQATSDLRTISNQGYKFSQPLARPNIKFTSPISQKDESSRHSRSSGPSRTKHRSRSSTREPIKRPPLLSAASDPALLTPTNSVLLTQLLTNNSNDQTVSPQSSSVLLTQLLTNNENSNLYRQCQSPSQNNGAIRIKEESTLTYLADAPAATTLIITSPVTFNSAPSPTTDQSMLNTFSSSNSPILEHSSQCLNSPTSSQGSIGSPIQDSGCRDQRRVGHIHAEQKRRYNIKNGFDVIHSLIPHLNQNPNARLSKAAMLQKGAEYIRQLRQERELLKEEMTSLRQQIESLNTSISNCQSLLPTNVAPINIRRDGKMQELFDEYVRNRTVENWKYWIFSLIFRPLLVSFNNVVSTSSMEDLYRSTILWVEQHCTLGDLRPVVLNSLRHLCTKTEILSEPERLPDEARQMCLSSKTNRS